MTDIELLDSRLRELYSRNGCQKDALHDVVLYACTGGKYVRGRIVLDIAGHGATELAVAVELLQAASLTIDDLPCMDNDSERRSKPSTFRFFGERLAILASLYMVSESLKTVAKHFDGLGISDLQSIRQFTATTESLIQGQAMDLDQEVNDIRTIIELKTCSLFMLTFSLALRHVFPKATGDGWGKVDEEVASSLGLHLGFMYQLADDVEDRERDVMEPSWKTRNAYLHFGPAATAAMYTEHSKAFQTLLDAHKLNSTFFRELVIYLDSMMIPCRVRCGGAVTPP